MFSRHSAFENRYDRRGERGDGENSMLKLLADQRTVPKNVRRLTAVETL